MAFKPTTSYLQDRCVNVCMYTGGGRSTLSRTAFPEGKCWTGWVMATEMVGGMGESEGYHE